jgi:hypothetical protein
MLLHDRVVAMLIKDYIAKSSYTPVISREIYIEFEKSFISF